MGGPGATQRSFVGGEFDPALDARVDLNRFHISGKVMRNVYVQDNGVVVNREGTEFLEETKDSTKKSRILPFIFSDSQTYVLELGDGYIRFYRNGARINVSSPTAWSNATSYVAGDLASRLGVNYYCKLAHTNQQPPNATYWYPLTGDIYEIPAPYALADLYSVKYDQDHDVISLAANGYAYYELRRSGQTFWTLYGYGTLGNTIGIPQSVTNDGAGGSTYGWVITAISAATGEESQVSAPTTTSTTPSSGTPVTLSWGAVSGAYGYNVYRLEHLVPRLIGTTLTNGFVDDGIEPEAETSPPNLRPDLNVIANNDSNAGAVAYFGQRLWLANTNTNPNSAFGSRIGLFQNFMINRPLTDDGSLSFKALGAQRIKHLVAIDRLCLLGGGGEFVANGDGTGAISLNNYNPKRYSAHGASDLKPVIIDNGFLFVDERGSNIRDFGFAEEVGGYKGKNVSVYSNHLVKKYSLLDWAHQKVPNSIVWIARSDGQFLALTYVREHEIAALTRCDTLGEVESFACVPEGSEYAVYLQVKRTINGITKRYIERKHSRNFSQIEDAVFLDCSLTYDGRNTGSTTMTLSGGTNWTNTELLTLTASVGYFVSGDVGNYMFFYERYTSGKKIGQIKKIHKFEITAYTSTTVVTVKCDGTVPVSFRNSAKTDWAKAVDVIGGLGHLEGEDVGIFADGFVVASPNNPKYPVKTVASAEVTLGGHYAVAHVGLPYVSDIQSLNIEAIRGVTLEARKKLTNQAIIRVNDTRGLLAGTDFPEDLDEDETDLTKGLECVDFAEDQFNSLPPRLKSESIPVNLETSWNDHGRLALRQVDPLPFELLSLTPSGLIPYSGG